MKATSTLLLVIALLLAKVTQASHHQTSRLRSSVTTRDLNNDAPLASDFGGIHLLIENDLDSSTPKFPLILVSNRTTYKDGMDGCYRLEESGYMPLIGGANLTRLLANSPVARQEVGDASTFWVNNVFPTNTTCQAIGKNGTIQNLPCDSQLPMLCSNTAPKARSLITANSHQIRVNTPKAGVFQGFYDQNSFRFLGIRYAQPPVRSLRFKPPQPYTPPTDGQNGTFFSQSLKANIQAASSVQDATQYGYACPQQRGNDSKARFQTRLINQVPENEDCLFLNVYTPSLKGNDSNALLPVMVYIHGGSYLANSGSTPFFEPGNLVSRGGVVVVTFNYRLGILGAFQNKAGGINATEAPGNLAIRDQILALQWVHDNIAAFSGSPDNITLFGESAGGYSIRALLVTPSAFPLYTNVIIQSDPVGLPLANASSMAYVTNLTMQALNCNQTDLACARNKTYEELVQAQYSALGNMNSADSAFSWMPIEGYFRPAVDHDLVTGDLFQQVGNGSYNTEAAIMYGFTKDEGGYFLPNYLPKPIPRKDLNATTVNYMPGFAGNVFLNNSKLYPINASDPDGVRSMLSTATTDWFFRCPILNITRSLSSRSSVYSFQFNYGRDLPAPFNLTGGFCEIPRRICHFADVIPSFASANYFATYPQTGNDARFARQIVDRFTTFAKTGTPNPVAGQAGYERLNQDVANVTWSPYNPSAPNTMRFNVLTGNSTQNLWKPNCDYLEQNQPYLFLTHQP